MKKILVYLMVAVFLSTGVSFADRGKGKDYRQERVYKKVYKKKVIHEHHYYHDYRGYAPKYRGYRYYNPRNYRGHWKSWQAWERYKRSKRHYRDGRYYRSNGQLYFEFQTDDGAFAFSIGR
jgi:hypothetical protein